MRFMRPPVTPGYVYVLSHAELPAWFKVGRTYRAPHARAKELSRTAWPTPMEVAHARFFWDSVAAERQIHDLLAPHGRRREFFGASLPHIRQVIQSLPSSPAQASRRSRRRVSIPEWDAPWAHRIGDADSWQRDLDRREEEWALGQHEVGSDQLAVRERGWRRWMRVSSEGWAEGSRRLADALVRQTPGPEGARQASWVFDAAGAQGLAGASFRATWLRTWGPEQDLKAWSEALRDAWHRLELVSWEEWPELIRDTLLLERALCARMPSTDQGPRVHAAQAFGGWDRLPPLTPTDV